MSFISITDKLLIKQSDISSIVYHEKDNIDECYISIKTKETTIDIFQNEISLDFKEFVLDYGINLKEPDIQLDYPCIAILLLIIFTGYITFF